MHQETSIALRDPIPAAVSRLELQRLSALYDAGRTKVWMSLPVGLDLHIVKAKKANAYYVVIVIDSKAVGYMLLSQNKVFAAGTVALKGWTALHTYLDKSIRGLGFMHRVYNMILTKGRLISAPTHTPKGMAMWASRIKTDNRNLYVLLSGKHVIPITPRSINNLRRTIWDGNPMTVLICAPKTDTKIKKLIAQSAA